MSADSSAAKANDLRGEVDIELDGQSFVLRPSHAAIRQIERATGKTLVQLAIAADEGGLTLDHAAIVIGEMIRAWGKAEGDEMAAQVNDKRIGHLLYEQGIMHALPRITMVLGMAATGGCTASGEPKAAGTTMIATPAAD